MRPRLYRFQTKSKLLAALAILLLPAGRDATYGQEATKPNGLAAERPAGQEFALRGQRLAREIKYSDWRKFCFKTPEAARFAGPPSPAHLTRVSPRFGSI